MNNLTIAGAIGRDAQTRTTQTGETVTGFSVAVSNGKDRDATWFDCSLWGDRGPKLAPYLLKGKRVTVSGRISARAHEGKAYLQLAVSQVTLQSSRDDGASAGQPQGESYAQQAASGGGYPDDSIPF